MSFMKTAEATRLYFKILPRFLLIHFPPILPKQFAVAIAVLQSAAMFMELCLRVFPNPELVTNGVIALRLAEPGPTSPEQRVLPLLRILLLPHLMWQEPIMFSAMQY